MSGKANMAGPGGDRAQEEILRKLEDSAAQRQIDIGGGVMVNMGQEDYGMSGSNPRVLKSRLAGQMWPDTSFYLAYLGEGPQGQSYTYN